MIQINITEYTCPHCLRTMSNRRRLSYGNYQSSKDSEGIFYHKLEYTDIINPGNHRWVFNWSSSTEHLVFVDMTRCFNKKCKGHKTMTIYNCITGEQIQSCTL